MPFSFPFSSFFDHYPYITTSLLYTLLYTLSTLLQHIILTIMIKFTIVVTTVVHSSNYIDPTCHLSCSSSFLP